ncbi:DUF4232 domain-containing protein [Propioniciclava coleopterorum]|uniref:DUF4232 domain-containing protein n=1 Tax=Propioniciclava coleopterorum TaxID=2714937 RepID=A0A6G7Y7E0_9ACTN|nr:DUF4232 domain-containing protein [Propioniciclava coleopterorum]QIK72732.1 DUF4232 domain-containing protein [Propioniciclava coleopterorum]
MHTLTRAALAAATVALATGGAIALVLSSVRPDAPPAPAPTALPSQPAPVSPTATPSPPRATPATTPPTPGTPPTATGPDAFAPSNPSNTCPDGSPVFRFGVVEAALGRRYLPVEVRNCGRPETVALDRLPELGFVNADGRPGAPERVDRPVTPLDVAPGESAFLMLQWRGGGSSLDPGDRAARVTFTVPGLGAGTWVDQTDIGPDSPVTLHGWGRTASEALDG